MRCAAFFRNVNLGRPNAPTRAQLEAAFLEAGAASATSFLVNGTLVFDVPPHARPRALASRACVLMRASCGLREPVFVRRVDELAALVASRPFDLHDGPARCAPHPRGVHAGSLRSGCALAGHDDPARCAPHPRGVHAGSLRSGRALASHDDPARCAPHPRGAHAGSLRSGHALASHDDPARCAPRPRGAHAGSLRSGRALASHDDPARCAPRPQGAHAGSLRSGRALAGADDPARRASAAGSVDDDLCCVSFLAGHRPALPAFPLTSARGDIDFVATTGAEVFSVARVVGKSAGSPNAWLERTLGAAATTRNWRTVVRLVEKFS